MKIIITDGIENKRVLRVDCIPEGWTEGKTKIKKVTNVDTIWITNGTRDKRVMPDAILTGWKKGRVTAK